MSTQSPAAPVVVEGLGVTYPDTGSPAVADVTVDLPDGVSLLVVGASGSGKSTLLGTLAGILGHTVDAHVTGSVRLAGVDVTAGGPLAAARVAGLVQQDPVSQTCLDTVTAEVELVAENRAAPASDVPQIAAAALAAAGASELAGRRTAELSGGQLQRVALAAALAARPRVLLLDEPTALLDPRAARDLGALVGSLSTPTVVVEHRLDDLRPLPGRMLVLDRGRPVALGSTADVLAAHGTRLLAAGCWVPLETLLDVAGAPAPLGDAATDAWLDGLAGSVGPVEPAPRRTVPAETAETAETVLEARGLTVSRSSRPGGPWSRRSHVDVVRGVDLRVARGEIVGVVGINGCGKSTLLRGLAGLERTSGHLRAGRAALVVQHPEQQFLCRTVADELAHGPRRAGLAETEVHERVDAAVRAFDLHGLEDRSPYRLSGGQQRRLSVATALATDTDVLLADEPTFGLDRSGTLTTARLLRAVSDGSWRRDAGRSGCHDGTGVVVVSHDLELLARCADRLVVLHDGQVVAHGPLDEVLADPAALAPAGLEPTTLIRWWMSRGCRPPLRALLHGLDDAAARAVSTVRADGDAWVQVGTGA